jgi:diacylglycerol kinase family enzyme
MRFRLVDKEARGKQAGGERAVASGLRLLLLVNDRSGRRDRSRDVVRLLESAGADLTVVALRKIRDRSKTVHEEAIEALTGRCKAEGIERIAVAGGDGSIGAAAWLALRAGLPLAIIPAGTANSLARWLGLPLRIGDAVRLAADPEAALAKVELAEAGGQPFVNLAATGLSVLASKRAKPLRRRLGAFAYTIGAAWAAIEGKPFKASVACDGQEVWKGKAWQVSVAASGAFGGGSATGATDPEDRRLDLAIVPACSRLALLRSAYAMRRGRLVEDDAVLHFRGRTIEVAMRGRPSFNVDGDLKTLDPPRFSLLGQVDVVVGKPASASQRYR